MSDTDVRSVNLNGRLRIQFKGVDGTVRTRVFQGLDKVQVLREDAKENAEADLDEGKKEG